MLFAIILFLFFANLYAQGEGDIPVTPFILGIQGEERLDLEYGGNNDRIGTFYIRNPDKLQFTLRIRFANKCKLKAFRREQPVELTNIKLRFAGCESENESSCIEQLRLMNSKPEDLDCDNNTDIKFIDDNAKYEIYRIEIYGDWDGEGSNSLAGFFTEIVLFTIIPEALILPKIAPKKRRL